MATDPFLLVGAIMPVLEKLNIPYLVGGSVASIIHGTYRATYDVDILADMLDSQVTEFASLLEPEFFVDEVMIRDEVAVRGSFNIIHRIAGDKIDIFVAPRDEWTVNQLSRRTRQPLGEAGLEPYVCSAEDIVLQKLKWYRMTNERSDKQWGDVTGVLKAQDPWIDLEYMRRWAQRLQVTDLLERALDESGIVEEQESE